MAINKNKHQHLGPKSKPMDEPQPCLQRPSEAEILLAGKRSSPARHLCPSQTMLQQLVGAGPPSVREWWAYQAEVGRSHSCGLCAPTPASRPVFMQGAAEGDEGT